MEGYGPKLYAELIRLLEKQVEARETDMFVGLTDPELSEYDKRRYWSRLEPMFSMPL